ncbi:MAG: biotin transporter BioY [Actinomycetota bacterium]
MTSIVISDVVPRPNIRALRIAREASLIGGFALFTAALAQVRIPLGFTPVPITGQTLAVLLAGATLGAWRGAGSQLLYWLLGMVGLPFYSNGTGGWEVATGPTMGYLVGFILAAAVVGRLAEYRHDRRVLTSVAAMTMGSMIIYVCGAAWLAINLGIPLATGEQNAIALGVTPFLVGDVIKMCLAGMATAGTWRFINREE